MQSLGLVNQYLTDSMAHFVVLGLTLFLSSQMLSTITVNDWAVDGVRILLLLGVLILGIVYAVIIIQEMPAPVVAVGPKTIASAQDLSMTHALSWLLIVPLIVYLFQSNLSGKAEARQNLWLLLLLFGGAFQCLFAVKQWPLAIYGFFGLLAAGLVLEVLQVAQSTLTTERKALTIVLFLAWIVYGLPQILNVNRELTWAFADILGVLLFLYFLLQEQ